MMTNRSVERRLVMKKINAALIISTLVFAVAAALVGCAGKGKVSESPASQPESSSTEELSETSEEETQPDPLAPKETEPTAEPSAETSTSATEPSESATDTQEPVPEPVTDENGAVILDVTGASDSELIAAAQSMYETACETSWKYHVGCPYTLDYSSFVENGMGWQFYLVTDEGINSLADVEEDYYKVFSSSYGNDLSEIYLEQDGRLYALSGERGADIFYTGSKVTGISGRSDSEIIFTVENYYSGDDMRGEGDVTETGEFSAVIAPDGSWRAGKFTLPY